jgi:ornithine cyclodeaminase
VTTPGWSAAHSQAAGVRLVSADELRNKVRFEDLVEPVARAFEDSSAGLADSGLIVMFPAAGPELGDVYVKTGTLKGRATYIVKVSPWFADNVEQGRPQGGFIAVFDSRNGHTLAILQDEHYLSDIRTAAAGALAARTLAPTSIQTAAVLGAGTQAYLQPRALYSERPFRTLVICARNPDKAADLAARLNVVLPEVTIRISADLEQTVRGADVLITATQAREPLVRGAWLHEGQHVTAVGADDATKCELDALALTRATVIVDSLETNARNGDVHRAIQNGEYSIEDVAGEIGDVLARRAPGRASSRDITIAKFVGIGVQDLAAAEVSIAKLGAANPTPTDDGEASDS